jgi:hypothetical protein
LGVGIVFHLILFSIQDGVGAVRSFVEGLLVEGASGPIKPDAVFGTGSSDKIARNIRLICS